MGDVTAPLTPPAKGAKSQSFLRDVLRRLTRERPVGAVSARVRRCRSATTTAFVDDVEQDVGGIRSVG